MISKNLKLCLYLEHRRTDNLAGRVAGKLEKKKAKREKKLMRAGFEGRRETAINGTGGQ